jgi:hypothetical protein
MTPVKQSDVLPMDVALGVRVDEAIAAGARLPRWGWPTPGPYNGATGQERVSGWQRLYLAEAAGWLDRPASCSICGRSGRIHLHTENYFRALFARALCQQCHFCLHRRFRSPQRWLSLIAAAPASVEWVYRVGMIELTREAAIALSQRSDPWSVDWHVRQRPMHALPLPNGRPQL